MKLELEICGDWIWIRGNTYQIKDQLKALGCYWANKKKAWYWRPADYVKVSKKEWSMEKIRFRFGSESFGSKERVLLAWSSKRGNRYGCPTFFVGFYILTGLTIILNIKHLPQYAFFFFFVMLCLFVCRSHICNNFL